MNLDDEEKFRKAFNVRRCEKCCGNCKHFVREYEDARCDHPKQQEFDSFVHFYGACGGSDVDEGNVCDLWEAKGEAE